MKGKLNNEVDRQGLIEYIQKLDLSRVFFWEIKKHVKRRSISQNSLYWLHMAVISDETGNDVNYLHEIFKEQFLIPVIVDYFGTTKEVRSTKRLTTKQFSEYMEKITAEVSSYGIVLPMPDDLIFDSFMEHYKGRL